MTPESFEKLNKMFEEAHKELATELGFPGWTFRDLPRMSLDVYEKLINVIGIDNIHYLAQTVSGDTIRGQVLISPDGISNLKQFNEEQANDE